jgi:hypothetical protein
MAINAKNHKVGTDYRKIRESAPTNDPRKDRPEPIKTQVEEKVEQPKHAAVVNHKKMREKLKGKSSRYSDDLIDL